MQSFLKTLVRNSNVPDSAELTVKDACLSFLHPSTGMKSTNIVFSWVCAIQISSTTASMINILFGNQSLSYTIFWHTLIMVDVDRELTNCSNKREPVVMFCVHWSNCRTEYVVFCFGFCDSWSSTNMLWFWLIIHRVASHLSSRRFFGDTHAQATQISKSTVH